MKEKKWELSFYNTYNTLIGNNKNSDVRSLKFIYNENLIFNLNVLYLCK